MKPIHKGRGRSEDADNPPSAESPASLPTPLFTQVLHGASLCELIVWTEEQWAVLPASRRPELARHFPGLGWVCCVPLLSLN